MAGPELEAVPLEAAPTAEVPPEEALLDELAVAVLPVGPVVPVAPVEGTLAEAAELGTVSGGAPALSDEAEPPPPHAARLRTSSSPVATSMSERDL